MTQRKLPSEARQEAYDAAVERVVAALRDPGPHHTYHFAAWRRCRHEWPTLFDALDELLRAYGDAPPSESLDTSGRKR